MSTTRLIAFMLMALVVNIIYLLGLPRTAYSFQNEPDCFRGIRWGENIAELRGMIAIGKVLEMRVYMRKNDEMKIGDAALSFVGYYFYQNQFCGLMVVYQDYTNFISIKDEFLQQYGNAQLVLVGCGCEEYAWLGQEINIYLRYNEIIKRGTITYIFTPLAINQK